MLCMDIKGPIQNSNNGFKYILVFIDNFSCLFEGAPMNTISAKEVIVSYSIIISSLKY